MSFSLPGAVETAFEILDGVEIGGCIEVNEFESDDDAEEGGLRTEMGQKERNEEEDGGVEEEEVLREVDFVALQVQRALCVALDSGFKLKMVPRFIIEGIL
jgi:hypothetical protein